MNRINNKHPINFIMEVVHKYIEGPHKYVWIRIPKIKEDSNKGFIMSGFKLIFEYRNIIFVGILWVFNGLFVRICGFLRKYKWV